MIEKTKEKEIQKLKIKPRKIELESGINIYIGVNPEDIEDDYAYLISNKGLMKLTKTHLYTSIRKTDKIAFAPEIDTKIKFNITKIPYELFKKVEYFFKKVYERQKTEACVILYFNKDTKEYLVVVPKHTKISLSGVEYEITEEIRKDIPQNFFQVGSIHSHGAMKAFHSGIDDDDEFYFDGYHITIGCLDEKTHDYASSLVVGDTREKVKLEEIVNIPKEEETIYDIDNWMKQIPLPDTKKKWKKDWKEIYNCGNKKKQNIITPIETNLGGFGNYLIPECVNYTEVEGIKLFDSYGTCHECVSPMNEFCINEDHYYSQINEYNDCPNGFGHIDINNIACKICELKTKCEIWFKQLNNLYDMAFQNEIVDVE